MVSKPGIKVKTIKALRKNNAKIYFVSNSINLNGLIKIWLTLSMV